MQTYTRTDSLEAAVRGFLQTPQHRNADIAFGLVIGITAVCTILFLWPVLRACWCGAAEYGRMKRIERSCTPDDGIVRGADAERIAHEIKHGTPNTAERVEAIRRADALYQSQRETMVDRARGAGL